MEEFNREQPAEEPANVLNVTNDESAVSDEGSQQTLDTEVENYGKFKSVKALLDAYNSLEAEFTKKCQRLSLLEQDKLEQATLPQRDLQAELNSFLASNSDAQDYKDHLMGIVEKDDQLQKVENPFEFAWYKLISSHVSALQTNKELDPIIGKYVLSNGQIQTKVVENYLKQLSENNSSPVIISSANGRRVSSIELDTPKTLKDAKKIVEDMFS